MGRPRKPLELQKGDLTTAKQVEKAREGLIVKLDSKQVSRNRPPDELVNEYAVKEWRRVVPLLKEIGLFGNLDKGNLIGYCNAFGKYCQAVHDDVDSKILQYGKEFRTFGSKLGMDPDSRLKLAAAAREKQDNEVEQQFGAI